MPSYRTIDSWRFMTSYAPVSPNQVLQPTPGDLVRVQV
jgi:hypothetical protein